MRFLHRSAPLLVSFAVALAACGGDPVVQDTDQDSQDGSTPSGSDDSEILVDSQPSSTTTTTSSTTPDKTTTTEPLTSFDVISVVNRKVDVLEVLVAKPGGQLLATVLDPEEFGCEGNVLSHYVTIDLAGVVTPIAFQGGGEAGSEASDKTFAGAPKASPSGDQILDVGGCEGFLGSVVLYDVSESLQLTDRKELDTSEAISGDATWSADGFISMFLTNDPPFGATVAGDIGSALDGLQLGGSDEGSDSADALEPVLELLPDAPPVVEYLVNPRTGERTRSGEVGEFHYGAVRLADGRLVFTSFGETTEVVIADRTGEQMQEFAASSFAVSPDANWMLVWDWVFDAGDDISIDLVNLTTGKAETLIAGSSLRAEWNSDSSRVAFANGLETYVYDLPTGDLITVGSVDPTGCEDDGYVVWGRVPLLFADNDVLYVGDAKCGKLSDGFPFAHYQLQQITLG